MNDCLRLFAVTLPLLLATACGDDSETNAASTTGGGGAGGGGGSGGGPGCAASLVGELAGTTLDTTMCPVGEYGQNINNTRIDVVGFDDGTTVVTGHFLQGTPSVPHLSLLHLPASAPAHADEWLCGGPSTSVTLWGEGPNTYQLGDVSSLGPCISNGGALTIDSSLVEEIVGTIDGETFEGSLPFPKLDNCAGRVCAFTAYDWVADTGFLLVTATEDWVEGVPMQIERAVLAFTDDTYGNAHFYCATGGQLTLSSSSELTGNLSGIGTLGGCPGTPLAGSVSVTN